MEKVGKRWKKYGKDDILRIWKSCWELLAMCAGRSWAITGSNRKGLGEKGLDSKASWLVVKLNSSTVP